MSPGLDLAIADGVALVTLARPEKLNALDAGMLEGLAAAAASIDADPSVRAVILTGQGKVFCAGGDITAWSALGPLAMGNEWVRRGHRVFDALARLRVPLIAALNGPAFGGGLELAATADVRIGETGLTLALPETGIGMVPGWSGTQRLVTRFGGQTVRRLALFGERLSAEEALAAGLLDAVVPAGDSLKAARAWAARLLARAPAATVITKQLINAAEGEDGAATLEMLAGALVTTTADLREGVASFREKRAPSFTGHDR